MGFFDLFKKSEPKQETKKEVSVSNEEKYYGDLNKTQIIFDLIKIPVERRDESWTEKFLRTIPLASFRCGEPQIVTGPDGYPYFQLLMPNESESFQCFVIDKMKDDFLIEMGYGIVINPTDKNADWVLTYGDILNYHLNGDFYSKTGNFSTQYADETVSENEDILIGQPSEKILPKQTREILNQYLKVQGIENPKVLLMTRKKGTQDLGFNITPENFEEEDHFRYVMQSISWFLPKQYSFVGLKESSFQEHFIDL